MIKKGNKNNKIIDEIKKSNKHLITKHIIFKKKNKHYNNKYNRTNTLFINQ